MKGSEIMKNSSPYSELLGLLRQIPPDWSGAEKCLRKNRFTSEQLIRIGYEISDRCMFESMDEELWGKTPLFLPSSYLVQILQLLLDYGMNPDGLDADDGILWNLQYVETPNVGAAAMQLMLEYGADPNQVYPGDVETLFENIHFDVIFALNEKNIPPQLVQCWLVLLAYGGCLRNGHPALKLTRSFDMRLFRDFGRYGYEIRRSSDPESKELYLDIYDRTTDDVVAWF